MVDDFLGNKKVFQSIYEFSINNKLISSNRTFIDLLYENNDEKISWFKNYLRYNNSIDFSIKKIESNMNLYKKILTEAARDGHEKAKLELTDIIL